MATPVLNVEEYQYGDDGIALNTTATLPFVDIEEVQGLDSGNLRTQVKDHEGTDGGFVDSYYETLRTVIIKGTIYADPANFESYLDTLKANYEPTQISVPFYFRTDAGMRVVYGKSQGLKYVKTNQRSYGKQPFNVTILCEDPRVYEADFATITVNIGSAVGGYGYNKGYPYGYGAVVTPNSGSLFLGGSREVPGTYTIYGPTTNPAVINDTLGLRWDFNISLSAADYLVINPRLKTVRLNGGASRRSSMKGKWWMLQPNKSNDFRLMDTGGTPGVTKLVVTTQPSRR